MLWTIARKELLETLRDGRFQVASGVILLLAVTSLGAGWKHHRDIESQHAEAQQSTRTQWLNQPKKNPHSAAHYGIYAFKPKSQLGIVDTGLDPYLGVSAWLEAHRQNEFRYRPAQDRTSLQRFGDLSAAVVLQVLLPLFVILMGFAAFAGEREAGTLRQVLSLGVSRERLLAGKALGVTAALLMVLTPAVVLGVAALIMTAEHGAISGQGARALLMVAGYLTYLTIFVGLALGVSAWLRSSRLVLVTLLAFWMFQGLAMPRVAADIADRLHPLPSAVAFTEAMDRDLSDTREVEQRLAVKRAALLERYNVKDVQELPVGFSGISLQEGEEHGNQVFDRHYNALFDIYERQNRAALLIGAVSPLVAVQSLSMALAGTDFSQHRHFVTAAEEHRRMMQRVLNDDIVEHQKPGDVYLAGSELWSRVPAFEYVSPSAGWALRHQIPAIVVLIGWLFLGASGALYAVRRATVA
jgi:ABC-2 type transport system permease protein